MSAVYVHIHRHSTADAAQRKAAGIVFVSDSGHVLLLKRAAGSNFAGFWGLPAGGVEPGETAKQAAMREAAEEIAYDVAAPHRLTKVWQSEMFTCFAARCAVFSPRLNGEHTASTWARPEELPGPLHPHVAEQINAALRTLKENS